MIKVSLVHLPDSEDFKPERRRNMVQIHVDRRCASVQKESECRSVSWHWGCVSRTSPSLSSIDVYPLLLPSFISTTAQLHILPSLATYLHRNSPWESETQTACRQLSLVAFVFCHCESSVSHDPARSNHNTTSRTFQKPKTSSSRTTNPPSQHTVPSADGTGNKVP